MDLAGTWALEMVVASVARAPLFGETRSASRSRMLVQIERDGDGWIQRHRVCSTAIEGGTKLARVTIPDGWKLALPERTYAPELSLEGGAWRYRADTGVQTVGYDPTRGDVPTRASDAQAVDADRDGKPGATVLVTVPGFGTAEVYVAQRGHSRLDGAFVTADRAEGRVVLLEQRQTTLGASHPLFDFAPTAAPDPSRSTFVLWRVDEGTDCAALAAIRP